MLVFEIKLYFFSSLNASPFSLFIILLSWESNVLENKFLLGLTFCIKNVNTSKVWFWTLRFLSLLLICSKYEHVNINMNMNKLWNKEISTAVTTSKSFSWLFNVETWNYSGKMLFPNRCSFLFTYNTVFSVLCGKAYTNYFELIFLVEVKLISRQNLISRIRFHNLVFFVIIVL